ncbi:peptidase S28 [Epithele typhae]|uniref:peptidase S28 n=1 Tax=Epithele typhae TaxID=378194 RepID=UPI0020073ED9|nr:peptidase S28 [Epithele typhae]KAH9922863.1 peptidase S28 [Epithele typhae]
MAKWRTVLVALVFAQPVVCGIDHIRILGPQAVNLWKLNAARTQAHSAHDALLVQSSGYTGAPAAELERNADLARKFPAQWFEQPLDHFANGSETWKQRYWVNTRHYVPGPDSPVFVLDGGETSGMDRLPFLDTGIMEILARATGGIGIVLEHRYYGKSLPVQNLTTDSLRFLNNAQSAADSANFMANVKFNGFEEDLTAPKHPWIYYGGSYAGARAAHMRVLYPELVYGAIASSGVTHASLENWEYMEIIRKAADLKCSGNLQLSIQIIDSMLGKPVAGNAIKGLFGLAGLEHDEDFASLVESPLGLWQARNWDPEVGNPGWDLFCAALDGKFEEDADMHMAAYDAEQDMVKIAGDLMVPVPVYNYARYIKQASSFLKFVAACPNGDVEECFGSFDDSKFLDTGLDQEWRLWLFQVCTEWGYFSTAPPAGHPRIVSSLLTLEYTSMICRQAYPPGKHFQVPAFPNLTAVNSLGDYDIAADRLAIIDGEVDPWRPVTPHSDYAKPREDTILRPFKVIRGGVHHWDENGRMELQEEPSQIQMIHEQIIIFVASWLEDWTAARLARSVV